MAPELASESGTQSAITPPPRLADAVPLAELRRVLVVKLRHHGDVLLTSPVFTALKAAAPQVEIDALVYADTADMLSGHPAIRQVHTIGRQWKTLGPFGQLRAELALLKNLRAADYDLLIHLTEHRRGAWLGRLLQTRWRVTFRVKGRDRFWNNSFTHFAERVGGGRRHTVDMHLDALRRIGIQPGPTALSLVAGPAAEQRVDQLLGKFGLIERRFIQIHPASRWQFKCWTTAGWAETITALQQDGWQVVLTAAPSADEQRLVEAIQARLARPAIDLAGQLSLKELAAVTKRARLFLGVDSAPMHIAAAVGTPTVVLFGPSGDQEWGPWQTPQRIITSRHSCRPCGLDGCGGGKVSDCLTSIGAARVIAASRELLAESVAE